MAILLLDVMGTLVHEPFRAEVPAFFGTALPALVRELSHDAWIDFELGKIDEATFAARCFRDGRALDYDGLVAALTGAYRYLDGIEPLLAALAGAGHQLHALSNYPVWYRLIESRLGLSRYLAWSFVSCETGVRKPDAGAYLGAAARLGVEPARCLFVDDRDENCAAARAVGMDAIRYDGTHALRAELIERGVLDAS